MAKEVQMRDLSEAAKPLRSSSEPRTPNSERQVSSWHAGASPKQVVPPKNGGRSRSFAFGAGAHVDSARLSCGRIDTRVELKLPSETEVQELGTFSIGYRQRCGRKPHVVAFVNSRSGGQIGGLLMKALTQSIGREEDSSEAFTGEVCDLSLPEEPESTIESLAEDLDGRRAQRRLLVCGGDGTVTWILTALEQCKALERKLHLLPVAIVPLGTGNDLARSLGWGPSLRSVSDILKYLRWVAKASPVFLDQWRLVLRPHAALDEDHKLHSPGSHPQQVCDEDLARQLLGDVGEALNDEDLVSDAVQARGGPGRDIYLGFWQNYFSVGMDAKVAGAVDRSRSHSCVGRCCFRRGCGKFCYGWQGLRGCCSRLLTKSLESFSVATPSPEALIGRGWRSGGSSSSSARPSRASVEAPPQVRMMDWGSQLRQMNVQGRRGRLRQLMLVNINSYAAGLNVLRENALVTPPSAHDGVLEVLAVRNLLSTICMFGGCSKPSYLASATKVAFRLTEGNWMQLDGEPWYLDSGCDVIVELHRTATMLCAPPDAPWWQGHVSPGYWGGPTAVREDDDQGQC